jgi:hypothetical protein
MHPNLITSVKSFFILVYFKVAGVGIFFFISTSAVFSNPGIIFTSKIRVYPSGATQDSNLCRCNLYHGIVS